MNRDDESDTDSLDSLFDGSDGNENVDTHTPTKLPLVHQYPPIQVHGLHIDNSAIPPQMQSEILSHLSFSPPSVTQQVIFGALPSFITDVLTHLHKRSLGYTDAHTHAKLFKQPLPRQCIINVYGYSDTPQAYHLAQHTDLARFGEGVMILSLGSSIAMRFEKCGDGVSAFEVLLRPGSVIYLTDAARYDWTHGIAARTIDNVEGAGLVQRGIRVGLTIRYYNQND